MTILGFRFGSRPNINAHMDLITSKYNARSWVVRHLKLSGVPEKDISIVFSTTIRSCIEYASVVYGPMLTKSQANELERMQRRALKIIYGHKTSYADALSKAGLKPLEERRIATLEKFTRKAAANPRLEGWFPKHHVPQYGLRTIPTYEEEHATTDRLYRSPIFTMRRLLNELSRKK